MLLFEAATPDGSRGKAVGIGRRILVRRGAYDRMGGWAAAPCGKAATCTAEDPR